MTKPVTTPYIGFTGGTFMVYFSHIYAKMVLEFTLDPNSGFRTKSGLDLLPSWLYTGQNFGAKSPEFWSGGFWFVVVYDPKLR